MKKLTKSIMTAGLLLVPIFFGGQQANAASTTSVQINGKALYFDQPPIMENNRVLVPMRTIFEVVGADVQWDARTSTVKAKKEGLSITLPLNSTQVTINGTQRNLDVPAKSVNGRTLVPLRFVSETLGCKVDWIPDQSLVAITFEGEVKQQQIGEVYPDGWVAPVLKSAWSPDPAINLRTLQNELGFIDGGRVYGISSYPQGAIHVSGGSSYEVTIKFYFWTDPALKESYRIPVVAKELFKLYFGGDADRVWNYCNSNDIPEQFTANGRNTTATYSPTDGAITFHVGIKNS